ncbi:hypothetical protein QWY20_11715 [Alkalimonas sp. MEB108]|uniref:Uncharacterized protein n=1 Tax=Alkalimonas cellulosilytica TaxID=3058395 RepID=A0ABU7J897_9GAMM|nr:hypothetical protein [Alkalimonas sp. MEB108]MEE2002120.1 hypothetical protein [Alkalimonas sp. MEB108]
MLNIQIDNPVLEADLKRAFGDNPQSVARAFAEFVQARKISDDIKVSEAQLAQGQGIELADVFNNIRAKYE